MISGHRFGRLFCNTADCPRSGRICHDDFRRSQRTFMARVEGPFAKNRSRPNPIPLNPTPSLFGPPPRPPLFVVSVLYRNLVLFGSLRFRSTRHRKTTLPILHSIPRKYLYLGYLQSGFNSRHLHHFNAQAPCGHRDRAGLLRVRAGFEPRVPRLLPEV
jgi:hypothetical protein